MTPPSKITGYENRYESVLSSDEFNLHVRLIKSTMQ